MLSGCVAINLWLRFPATVTRRGVCHGMRTFLLQASLFLLLQQPQSLGFADLFLAGRLNEDHNIRD